MNCVPNLRADKIDQLCHRYLSWLLRVPVEILQRNLNGQLTFQTGNLDY